MRPGSPIKLLEVGCGSGGIAHHFATHPDLRCDVDATDVVDNRQVSDGYRFHRVDDVRLPFADGSFDVAISNHVIEHVGDRQAQSLHLDELHRVLRHDGIAYLAVPNRWMLVEPHYRLAFLSWLPVRWRTPYLRLSRRGRHYDCLPLSRGELEGLLAAHGFDFEQCHGEALLLTFEIERPRAPAYRWLFRWIPDFVFRSVRSAFPTLIYRLRRADRDDGP